MITTIYIDELGEDATVKVKYNVSGENHDQTMDLPAECAEPNITAVVDIETGNELGELLSADEFYELELECKMDMEKDDE